MMEVVLRRELFSQGIPGRFPQSGNMEHYAGYIRTGSQKYQGVDALIGQQYILIDYHSVNQALASICRMIFFIVLLLDGIY